MSDSNSVLVRIYNNDPCTGSFIFSMFLEVPHNDVKRTIRNIGCSEDFAQKHFVPTSYCHGTKQPSLYRITYPGFVLLADYYNPTHKSSIIEYLREFIRVTEQLQLAHAFTLTDMQNTLDNIEQEVAA